MKEKFNNKYFKWSLSAFCVIGASILLYFFFLRFNDFLGVLGRIMKIFKPLLYGIVISFLLTQVFNFFNRKLTDLFISKMKNEKDAKKWAKILSIVISLLILFFILFIILYMLIPSLVTSILSIIETWSYNTENIELWLRNILKVSPTLEEIILSAVNESSSSILEWISNALLPQMKMIMDSFTTGLSDMYVFVSDFVIGIVFSIYILSNKNKFVSQLKKFVYTVLNVHSGNSFLQVCRYSYKIFNGFVKGKLLTSCIIGVACYIGMIILGLPHKLLISLIIAITNIIPFFGPIIGWIPCVIIIAMNSPISAIYFTILIIILQQIEGNILEPKIVGDKTGLSGFWVLFAIIVFGDLFGFVGMIFGVPLFAIIYHFVTIMIDKYLLKKELPINSEAYEDLKYIDETTKRPVKIKSTN